MGTTDSRNDWLGRARSGDRVALKVLLSEIHGRLAEMVRRRIPPDYQRIIDADDILVETHVEVYRHIGGFEPQGDDALFRWAATIALNRLRTALKRERTKKRGGGRIADVAGPSNLEQSSLDLWDKVAGSDRSPSRVFSKREAVDALHEAMRALPPHYRQAVWLVYIEGMPVREVAVRVGKTERAVHGLCRRGIKLMQKELGSASRFLTGS